jgi:hypothetical protein
VILLNHTVEGKIIVIKVQINILRWASGSCWCCSIQRTQTCSQIVKLSNPQAKSDLTLEHTQHKLYHTVPVVLDQWDQSPTNFLSRIVPNLYLLPSIWILDKRRIFFLVSNSRLGGNNSGEYGDVVREGWCHLADSGTIVRFPYYCLTYIYIV